MSQASYSRVSQKLSQLICTVLPVGVLVISVCLWEGLGVCRGPILLMETQVSSFPRS